MEPIAWAVMEGDDFLFLTKEESAASSCAGDTGGKFVPLIRLSDAEGEIASARAIAEMMLQGTGQQMAEALAQRVIDGHTIGRWIPVGERLPPIVHRPGQSSDDVFIALQYPDGEHLLTIGYYSHSDQIWHSRTAKHGWQPSHWMPLPEPPEVK